MRQPCLGIEPVDDLFAELPGLIQQAKVCREADRLRCNGGIEDGLSLMRRFF